MNHIHDCNAFKSAATVEDVLEFRKGMMFFDGVFVEFSAIGNEATQSVWFWDDEHWHSPFTGVTFFDDAEMELALQLGLDSFLLMKWDGMRLLCVEGLGFRFEFDVTFAIWKDSKRSVVETCKKVAGAGV